MKFSVLLTFWFIDIVISSEHTSLEIKNLNYIICFWIAPETIRLFLLRYELTVVLTEDPVS
jgi:hypothetical protein